MISVINVVKNARNLKYPINIPLMLPSNAPNIRVAATANGTGHLST